MIPNSKPRISRERLVANVIGQGLWKNDNVTRTSVIGVRGYYFNSLGQPNDNDRGIYDDAIFIITPDTFASFNGNTDPSRYKLGRAVLQSPQKVTYKPGYHGYGRKSGHPAFRQASDVVVIRDGGKGNGTPLGGGRFRDSPSSRFWINLHRGGWTTTSSAGCQTIPPNQWGAFYGLVRLQLERYNQKDFAYYLIEAPLQ